MTLSEAEDQIPDDAQWTASFGNAGELGYRAYFRAKDGTRYVLSNGPFDALQAD